MTSIKLCGKIALLFAALIICVSCKNTSAFVKAGLVAYYPFSGNANDASGNKNVGRVIGAIPCKDRFGKANSAFSFNGVDNYVSFESAPLKQIDNWTLSAWINPTSTNQYAMAKDNYYPGNHLTGVLGGVKWIASGYTFLSPSVWYHVVMLRTNGITKFYVNGIQTVSTESSVPIAPTAFTIGSATRCRFFNGMIDDVRIYGRALSDSEVQQLYNFEMPPQ
jgi:hypothetical protein